jgi:acyl-coenzyme A synthetase/AMP-(fatty) acid ligase
MPSEITRPFSWIDTRPPPLDLNGPVDVAYSPLRPALDQPLKAWFAAAASLHAGRVAIDDGAHSLTYAELWAGACRMANLVERSTPHGRPIAVLLPNIASYPMAWLGCLLAGRPAALLDSNYPAERNRVCRDTARPGAVIGGAGDTDALALAGDLPYLSIESASDDTIDASPPDRPASDGDAAFIIFTSGSTGRPKGIAISAAAALHRATTLIDSVHMNPTDAVLSVIPPCALGGMLNLLETYLAGATLLKLDLPRAYLSAHAGKSVTMLFATPAMLRVISRLDDDGALRRGLRLVQPVGDSLLLADLRQLRDELPRGCTILNSYGSTEALVSLQWFLPEPYTGPGPKVASGYRVAGYDCALVAEDGSPAAAGQTGELVVRSRHMSLGEWRDGGLEPGPFMPDPDDPASRIHRTGDLALLAADGLYTVIGRRDRQVQIRGNRVEPAEIEEALRGQPWVKEAVVLARPRHGDPELIAFIVPTGAPTADLHARITHDIQAALPPYMQPNRFVFLSALPLLPGGKIDVAALLARPPA